jgi:ABC-type glutathione transport system ATPase component
MPDEAAMLEVELSVDYTGKPGALRNVAFRAQYGEMLGLVGESGSGKSTIALALLGLLRWKRGRATGRVKFYGRDLLASGEGEMQRVRGQEIALVLQSPLASLNPALRIGTQLGEAWRAHAKRGGASRYEAVRQALSRVGLPTCEEFRRRRPSQISVGQAQRVLIAMAVMHSPALLIADEPTSALDAMTQAEILDMLARLNREMGMAVLYISHDLQSVASLCNRVAILQNGSIVEQGGTRAVLRTPRHPYTQQLMSCAPWLQWWLQESQHGTLGRVHVDAVNCGPVQVPSAPVQVYWGLKSPCQPPIG